MEDSIFDFVLQKDLLLQFRNLHQNVAKARARKNTWVVPVIAGFGMGLVSCLASLCLVSSISTIGKLNTSEMPDIYTPILIIVWLVGAYLVYIFNKKRLSNKIIESEKELESATESTMTKYPEWVSEIGGRESLLNLGKLNKLIDIYVSSASNEADGSMGISSRYHIWNICACKICNQTRHAWNGCMCSRCKMTRDMEHEWNGCKCKICNKTRDQEHDWDGCKCKRCDQTRDQEHDWDHCICKRCRNKRWVEDEEHDWKPESVFSVTEDKYIEWYECSRCGVTKPD